MGCCLAPRHVMSLEFIRNAEIEHQTLPTMKLGLGRADYMTSPCSFFQPATSTMHPLLLKGLRKMAVPLTGPLPPADLGAHSGVCALCLVLPCIAIVTSDAAERFSWALFLSKWRAPFGQVLDQDEYTRPLEGKREAAVTRTPSLRRESWSLANPMDLREHMGHERQTFAGQATAL